VISGWCWPNEIRTQAWINWTAVIRFCNPGSGIIERMIGGWQVFVGVAHQIGYYYADAALFVVEHDRSAAGLADAQFQWAAWVLVIERHAFEAACTLYRQIAMFEKHYVGSGLSGNTLANRAMAGVVIDRILVGMGFVMGAAAIVFVCHGISSEVIFVGA
jgi:hypothetical protein